MTKHPNLVNVRSHARDLKSLQSFKSPSQRSSINLISTPQGKYIVEVKVDGKITSEQFNTLHQAQAYYDAYLESGTTAGKSFNELFGTHLKSRRFTVLGVKGQFNPDSPT